MYNFSVDPQIVRSGKIAKDVLVAELSPDNVEEYDDRLLSAWPADWPGRTFVDLDNVGDPSVWLSGSLPEGACSQIMGSSTYDGDTADDLTNAYTCAQDENYFPLPNEFGVTDDIMMATIRDDFIGLIKEWRRRVMDTIDRQRSLA